MSRSNCTKCNAYKKCDGPIQYERVGKGPVELLIVGESPGKEEEQQVLPFVGQSGQLLRNTLETVTNNYILTNSRCCYGEKKPSKRELQSCKARWEKLIIKYRPKVVCCLGQYSAKVALNLQRPKMKKLVGVVSSVCIEDLSLEYQVVVQYRPAFMLRLGSGPAATAEKAEDEWSETWELIDNLIRGKMPELPKVRNLYDPEEIITYLNVLRDNYEGDFSYDYETDGDINTLRPGLNNRFDILCVGLATEFETVAFPLEHPNYAKEKMIWKKVRSAWEAFLFFSYGKAIGQNAKYEHKCNLVKFGQTVAMGDTMLQMNLLDENLPANLGAIAKYCELPWHFYKKQMAGIQANPLKTKLPKLLLYCGLDALTAFTAYDVLGKEIEEQGLGDVLGMAEDIAYALSFVEISGMAIKGSVLAKLGPEFEEKATTILKKIHKYGSVQETINWAVEEIKSWKGERQPFNPRSSRQMKHLCLDVLDLPVDPNFEGSYDLDKKVLAKFESKHPIIKDILAFRSVKSILSNFIAKWHVFTGPDNCIHTVYTQEVTATGRLSSKEMNLQNIPKGNEVRRSLHSRYKNGLLLSSDYVQVEPMVVAGMSGDKNMKKAFVEGLDLHLYTASQIYDIDFDEMFILFKAGDEETLKRRFNGKQMNLGTMYGITKYGLSGFTGLSLKQSQYLLDKYNDRFPGVYDFRIGLHRQAMDDGYVSDLFGRRRHLPDARSSDRGKQKRAFRQAGNFPGQSTANYFCLISLCILRDLFRERNIRAVIIGAEHDKLYIDMDSDWKRQTIEAVNDAMLVHNDMDYWKPMGIELKVDMHMGKNLYEMGAV